MIAYSVMGKLPIMNKTVKIPSVPSLLSRNRPIANAMATMIMLTNPVMHPI